jgi:hypothetical protein
MKAYKFLFIIVILSLLPAYSYGSTIGLMHINLMQGDVQIKTDDTLDWVAAAINMPLKEGDRLWVPEEGRLEIRLQDGTFVRLDQNSSIELLTVEDGSYQFYLSYGRAYVNFRGQSDAILQVDTPLSAVRTYDSSKFKIEVLETGFTKLSVINGAVYAESRSGQTRVGSGKTLSIGEDQYAELSPLGASDEWERWNRERDNKLYAKNYDSEYLPSELRSYSYDFDYYGRWVHTASYGYVWTPTFSISVGWTPYTYGRWTWVGGDYVWISSYPWGWVPFHYGRWTWAVSIGWCWVPPPYGYAYWGPGYVGWHYTPHYVTWVPLGPKDPYYGYGYYGPHSTNLHHHRHLREPIFYEHAHTKHAVMTVTRDAFLKGEYSRVALKDNPFKKGVLTAGRPDIKPERATTRPFIKEVPSDKRPPQLVRTMDTKELKKSRPFVTSRTQSVMKPETRSKTMTVKKVDRTTTQVAKMDRWSLIGKRSGQGVSKSTQAKQGASQRPFKEKQLTESKRSLATTSAQKSTGTPRKSTDSNPEYRGKQPDAQAKGSFDRYQPYSKQKGSDTQVTKSTKRYTESSERKSGKTSPSGKSRASLQKSQSQDSRKAYTSRGSSVPLQKSRQQSSTTSVTKRKSSGTYKSSTPIKRESQKTYSYGKQSSSFYDRSPVGRSSRGLVSGSGYRSQPRTGVSMPSTKSSSMGSYKTPSMGLGRR